MIAGRDITHTKAILSAEGAVAVAENSSVLYSAKEKYTPVTSALIDLALGHTLLPTINIPEIAGGVLGIKLADKKTRITSKNNLPIIHIAAPNSRGVSHNHYQEFNVGALGLVLNNATGATQSVLAGPIKANPHFNGKSAELIINEVVGTLTSNLQGLLEVVGQKASVFIANPNGITCDGCGFVNTPAVTLSTGKPVFDKDGALAALAVKKGTITIGEKGLDATAQNDVDIISRAAILNGKVQAKNLTLTQGPNQVDFKHGTVVPIAGEGDSPGKAIDTGSLGGMYANKIRLVSTEAGKEVNLANLTATQGDISLTADGELSLANALIKRAKNIFLASNGEIEISLSPYLAKFNDNQSSTDSDALNDDAQRGLINQRLRQFSQLEADENIEIHAGAGVNLKGISLTAGKDITLTSGNSLDISKAITANNKDTETTKLTAKQGGISLTASGKVALGDVQAQTDITVNGKDIETMKLTAEQGGISLTASGKATLGDVQAQTDITVNGKDIETMKLTAEQGGISLTASGKATLGDVQAQTDITVNGKDIETMKLTAEQGGISLTASGKATLGDVQAKTDITVNSKDIETAKQSNMQAGQNLILTTETLRGQGEIRADSDVTVRASHLSFYGGNLKAGSHVLLQGEKNLTVYDTNISGHDITLISSGGGISVSSGGGNSTAENTRSLSTISAANTLHILSEQGISLSNTLINRAKNVFLAGNGRVDINQSLGADENIELHAGAGVNLRDISLTAGKDITLTSGDSLDIGKVIAGNNLTMIAGDRITNTTLLAEGETAFAQNSTVLYSAEGKYTPVTSALIDLGLGNAPRLTINIPEIEGEAPGIKLAGKQTRIILKNNLPIIHIAAPNSRGVSHNYYQEFNVGALGLVFNNATGATQSVLAGLIRINPNFNGKSAELIINEVVGTVASNLQGLLEVVGQKANVFIANPNGIICNGCSFVNTPAVTLSTGKPVFDKDGALEALEVKKGTIIFGEKGLDATAQDSVDIISRAAIFNGKVQAKNLTLTQGSNLVDVKHGTVVPITGEGNTPWKAIDTGALGGMYANKIRLVSTEVGKEVNLANLTTTQGDISLTSDGEATLENVQAKMGITVSSKGIKTAEQSNVQAGKDITLATNMLNNRGKIIAEGDMRLFVERLDNQGNEFNGASLISAKNIFLHAGEIIGIGHFKAESDLSAIADRKIDVSQGKLEANRNLALIAGKGIEIYRAALKGENVELLAHEGDINVGWDGSNVSASNNLHMFASNKLDLRGILLDKSENITLNDGHEINVEKVKLEANKNLTLIAGKGIEIYRAALKGENVELLAHEGDINVGWDGSNVSASNNLHMFASNKLDLRGILLDKSENITLNAGHEINVEKVKLEANKNLTLIAGKHITDGEADLKGENVELLVREGDILMGRNRFSSLPSISAYNSLRISAGNDLDLYDILLDKSHNLMLSAGRNIDASQGKLNATGNINLFAGNDLILRTTRISAGQQVTLGAGHDIDMYRHNPKVSDSLFYLPDLYKWDKLLELKERITTVDLSELGTQITAGDHLQLSASGDIVGKVTKLTSTNGSVLVNAGRDLIFSAQKYSPINDYKQYLYATSSINAAKNLTLVAAGNLLTYGTRLISGSDMMLSTGGNIRFESSKEFIQEGNIGRFTQHASQLNSGGALTIRSQGSILFQATELIAKGAMDIAAKGGFLYAQAMEETYRWEEERKSCKRRAGIKSCKIFGSQTETRIKESSTNKVTEFTAGGDINLMAKDDVTLEASKIETNKNAKITSQTGKVNFRAMPNIDFEQTITTSKGLFITHRDQGSITKEWVIPSIYVGGTLTVGAAKGISADVKVKEGQSLEDALVILGSTSGIEWLKNLKGRNDVQWNLVKDAYSSWDKKSESLNPVASVVIAIAVAAATAGSGLAAWAGSGAVGAMGATGATASAVYGAAYGGMIGLTSQAAVALVENKGNITNTLETLAKRDSVKSLVTQMAVGGALGGLDHAMGWGKLVEETSAVDAVKSAGVVDTVKTNLPLLSNNNWSRVAQRIAAHSVVSSTIGTAINRGSFTDNLQTALLSSIGNQINAEVANLIGENGKILGHAGKALSHAVVAGIGAEIAGGDAKGAAAGSLAASLAYPTLDNTFSDPAKIQAGGKIIGGIAGAFSTNSAQGANSGANSGEITIVYNHLAHALSAAEKHKLGTIKAHEEKTAKLCVQSPDVCERAAATFSVSADFLPVIGDIKGFTEAETAIDYLAAAVGLIPGAGDAAGKLLKGADKALKHGDLETASKLIHQASNEIGVLVKPGTISHSNNGIDAISSSSRPEWLKRMDEGNQFNTEQAKNYPYNEVYVDKPDGSGYYRVDSYNPAMNEIVSRKHTQFSEIKEMTAFNYIREAVSKYPSGATIANVPSSGGLAGNELKGNIFLEVPPQTKPIPQSILDEAKKSKVIIRDINGKIYQ
ncbi:hypothetical protein CKY01_11565 [Photorhabdus laumondii subsp. clarkei]|uniref:Filamentous haemagglutinin FhaB/tRNA nuclease CdiA-like TPS domain-containing protein n=2 Tax=Photorhabdus TaxID=29487 RepID=A0A329VI79_9GAMM|nr:hypothetical protein CKY01_11565 [Photorhabdus laumondii subsp. clarkei]